MGPIKEKEKQPRKAPDFIDDKFIKTLPKDKQAYWKRRKEGKDGVEKFNPYGKVIMTPPNMTMGFNNQGEMIVRTRAVRRRKPPTDNIYTKKTHSILKARNKK